MTKKTNKKVTDWNNWAPPKWTEEEKRETKKFLSINVSKERLDLTGMSNSEKVGELLCHFAGHFDMPPKPLGISDALYKKCWLYFDNFGFAKAERECRAIKKALTDDKILKKVGKDKWVAIDENGRGKIKLYERYRKYLLSL